MFLVEKLKRMVRILEALVTPRRGHVEWAGRKLSVVRSLWWDEARQDIFDKEIVPYFKVLGERSDYSLIVDAGAATGLFTLAAGVSFPNAKFYVFEPSLRQRVLLRRNVRSNGLGSRVLISGMGLWNCDDVMAFRTHGAISSLQSVSQFPPGYPCCEKIHVVTIDHWVNEAGVGRIGLIKMDIEGAEIEALLGAEKTLRSHRPDLLIQAYHLRSGSRTYERCNAFLRDCGYFCREMESPSGMLYATYQL